MDERERRRRNDELEGRLGDELHRLGDAARAALRPTRSPSPDDGVVDDEEPATDASLASHPVEQLVGPHLDDLDGVVALHRRRVPETPLVIDHLVVAPSGVHVVRARRAPGKVRARRDGTLHASGKDRSNHIESMRRQRDAVGDVLADPTAQLTARLCLIDAEWPLRAKGFEVGGVIVTWPKALLRDLVAPGPLGPAQVMAIAEHLHIRLPPG